MEMKRCKVGRVRCMRKDFRAAGVCFHMGNLHVVNRGVVMEKEDSCVGIPNHSVRKSTLTVPF